MESYIWIVPCQNPDCSQFGLPNRIVDATDPTTCGSCYGDIKPIKTDEVWVGVSELAEEQV